MAFITVGGVVTSYAEYTDVLQKDQRILESNELVIPAESGFADVTEFIEDMLTKSTNRINLKIKASNWWINYLNYTGQSVTRPELAPDFNPNRIVTRKQEFTDMCVYYCFKEYLCPLIADFGEEDSPEVQKIKYYDAKFNDIFNELLAIADWYDADGDGTVEDSEKTTYYQPVRRSRSRRSVARIR